MEKESNAYDDSASAPSYEEAMKCPSVPPYQLQPDSNNPYATATNVMQQPLAQPNGFENLTMVPSQQQQQPHPPQALVQNVQIAGLPIVCRCCGVPLQTRVSYRSTCSTHCAFLCCCICFMWICAPLVYCMDSCREPRLQCAHCGAPV